MTKKEYREALKDYRWKDKRQEILIRDNHTCTKCEATSYLEVHHLKYSKGGMPWEVPNSWLITLCAVCHKEIHGIVKGKDKRVRKGKKKTKKNPEVFKNKMKYEL